MAISMGRPILAQTADRLIWAALQWRLSIVLLIIVVSPRRSDLRLLDIDDADARVCSRWFSVYLTVAPFNFFLVWLVARLGFAHDAVFGAATLLGLMITLYNIEMFWATRHPWPRWQRQPIPGRSHAPPYPLQAIHGGVEGMDAKNCGRSATAQSAMPSIAPLPPHPTFPLAPPPVMATQLYSRISTSLTDMTKQDACFRHSPIGSSRHKLPWERFSPSRRNGHSVGVTHNGKGPILVLTPS